MPVNRGKGSPFIDQARSTSSSGLRLLPPGDPFILAWGRELLFPEKAVRQRVWRAIGSPGLVLAAGRPAALWRPLKQGRRLEATVEPLAPLSASERAASRRRRRARSHTADVRVSRSASRR